MKSPFDLFLFSTDTVTIRRAVAGGVAGAVVDWERVGKAERQSGFDTQINDDTVDDLRRVRDAVSVTLICRLNRLGPESSAEIESAIDAGADEVLLPMVRDPSEVEAVLERAAGRCQVGFLVETTEAVARIAEFAGLPVSRVSALFVMGTAGAASRVASAAIRCASPNHQISRLPGLRGILAPKSYLDDIRRRADDLDVLLERKDAVFLLSARSGMFSLVGNRTNPTPFDYPFVTTLGSEGEDGLIAMLESGRIQRVCIDTLGVKAGPLWPAKFEAEVQRRFRVVGWAGNWVLYGRADEPSQ